MTNAQFYDLILEKCRRSGDLALRALIASEFRQFLQRLEHGPFHPWFLETYSVFTLTPGSIVSDVLPEDFLLQVEDTKFRMFPPGGAAHTTLARIYHEDLEDQFDDAEFGTPIVYDIYGGQIWVGPGPDLTGDYNVRLKYYRSTTPPADDNDEVDNPWLLNAEDFIVCSMARRMTAQYIKDMARAADLEKEAAVAKSELHRYNEARKHADMDYAVTD